MSKYTKTAGGDLIGHYDTQKDYTKQEIDGGWYVVLGYSQITEPLASKAQAQTVIDQIATKLVAGGDIIIVIEDI